MKRTIITLQDISLIVDCVILLYVLLLYVRCVWVQRRNKKIHYNCYTILFYFFLLLLLLSFSLKTTIELITDKCDATFKKIKKKNIIFIFLKKRFTWICIYRQWHVYKSVLFMSINYVEVLSVKFITEYVCIYMGLLFNVKCKKFYFFVQSERCMFGNTTFKEYFNILNGIIIYNLMIIFRSHFVTHIIIQYV